jgi:hypothetical protein
LAIALVAGTVMFAGAIVRCALALARLRRRLTDWISGQYRRLKVSNSRLPNVRQDSTGMA